MLHKCANPDCSSVFRRLSHGKLFLLEIDQAMESSHRPSPTTPQPTEENGRREEWNVTGCATSVLPCSP
jgi:hypothetical protein